MKNFLLKTAKIGTDTAVDGVGNAIAGGVGYMLTSWMVPKQYRDMWALALKVSVIVQTARDLVNNTIEVSNMDLETIEPEVVTSTDTSDAIEAEHKKVNEEK